MRQTRNEGVQVKVTTLIREIAVIGLLAYIANKIQFGLQVGYNADERGEPSQGNIGFQILTTDSDDIGDRK